MSKLNNKAHITHIQAACGGTSAAMEAGAEAEEEEPDRANEFI